MMRTGAIPFRFDISDLAGRLRRLSDKHIGTVTLSLPGVSVPVSLKDREKTVAREIVIRLRDRRVLSSWECCDNCTDQALASLQEIRKFLVEKQVELSDLHDGALFIFVDAMAAGIRQFLTFEQSLAKERLPKPQRSSEFHRAPEVRQEYFDALELLRGHLNHCLEQVYQIAAIRIPDAGLMKEYMGGWQIEAYETPKLPKAKKSNARPIAQTARKTR